MEEGAVSIVDTGDEDQRLDEKIGVDGLELGAEEGLKLGEFETIESVRVKGMKSCSEVGVAARLDGVRDSDNS